jgi:hypothetical protein
MNLEIISYSETTFNWKLFLSSTSIEPETVRAAYTTQAPAFLGFMLMWKVNSLLPERDRLKREAKDPISRAGFPLSLFLPPDWNWR